MLLVLGFAVLHFLLLLANLAADGLDLQAHLLLHAVVGEEVLGAELVEEGRLLEVFEAVNHGENELEVGLELVVVLGVLDFEDALAADEVREVHHVAFEELVVARAVGEPEVAHEVPVGDFLG